MTEYRSMRLEEANADRLSISFHDGGDDANWDRFLMKSPLGHFQQSSMWARVKEMEGWQCLRAVASVEDKIIGGFQILYRNTRFGRIGYVSKGPVAFPETSTLIERLVGEICELARRRNILAVLVQPPDDSRLTPLILAQKKLVQNNPLHVIEATYLIDLQGGFDVVEKGYHKSVRRNLNKARRMGVVVREAGEAEIGIFFDLMLATCARNSVRPNPATLDEMKRFWSSFISLGCIQLTLAECGGQIVAGCLNVPFGNRVTQWKKGWNGSFGSWHPNEILTAELIRWAVQNGYKYCDFAGINRDLAEVILKDGAPKEVHINSRDGYNLRFGGYPKLLPAVHIWISNPAVRIGYLWIVKYLGRFPLLKKLLQ